VSDEDTVLRMAEYADFFLWDGAPDLQDAIRDLRELVKWLALPFGDNEPIFATKGVSGETLETGVKLRDLYRSIVGEKEPVRGIWFQCPTCNMWQVDSTIP